MTLRRELYQHRQFGWLMLLGPCICILILVVLLPYASGHAAQILPRAILPVLVGVGVVVALLFGSLTISVTTQAVEWRFGIGLLRGHVDLSDIGAILPTRTSIATGWGIRRTRRGWLYNVSGLDALEIRQKSGKILFLGTDEPKTLQRALERAIADYGS